MEQPIDGSCSFGPWPVSAIIFIASKSSRRVFAMGIIREASSSTAVLQLVLCVEAEEIGCALSIVSARQFLARINHVGKGKAVLRRERLHVVEGVLGIALGVVWHDGNCPDANLT